MKKNVFIIGAGPAGLTTAYTLLKEDKENEYNVTIIEESDKVGGISKTIELGDGYLVDTGIHRFFSKSKIINDMWNELLPLQSKPAYDDIILEKERKFPQNGSDPEKDEKSMLIKDRVTRILYNKKFFDYPVSLSIDTLKKLGCIKLIKVGCTYLSSCIVKKEETSLENFYINRFGLELYNTFFKNYTTKVWGISPSEISADWGAQRVKKISISEIFKDVIRKKFNNKNSKNTETSLIEEFIYPKLGAGQVWQVMADKIEEMGGKIILNSKVIGVIKEKNEIKKVEYLSKMKKNDADVDILISSMPIKDLFVAIGKENVEDNNIYELAVNLPYRDFIVVYLLTDKLKLKNTTNIKTPGNIIPDDWIYIQEDSVKMGRMQIFNNWSPYLFKNKKEISEKSLISLEYFASEGDELWKKSEESMINFALAEAKEIGIIEVDANIELSKSIKISKAYPSYFGTYKDMEKIKKWLNKIDNLYCVGRNGQHRYNNMDHSMLTGIEVANNILNGVSDRSNIWNINTEKEYHEKK